jgi:glyoxylase-like metal-dependent hydrolase (beta-lactamase superfamily II)
LAHHTFQQITSHVHWLSPDSSTDRPVVGVIHGARATLVVDAGNSSAHAELLLREIAHAGIAPPDFVALTHWHWDHVFGTSTLEVPTFAHVETQRVVRKMATLDWSDAALDRRVETGEEVAFCRDMIKAELPNRSSLSLRPPDIAFTCELTLDLGGVTCRLVHVGGDHSADSIVVFVPEDGIVFLGDCMYPDIYHVARRYTTKAVAPLFDRLLAFDATCYLAGHNPEPMSRAAIVEEAALLTTIGNLVERHADDRGAILTELQHAITNPIDDDHIELVDMFLAGLDTPVLASRHD